MWKSQEDGQWMHSPRCAAYIWWSSAYNVHFLSDRVHDESVLLDREIDWDALGIICMI